MRSRMGAKWGHMVIYTNICSYMLATRCQHGVNKLSTRCQHAVNTLSTRCPHAVNTLSTRCHQLSARCQHDVNTVSTQFIFVITLSRLCIWCCFWFFDLSFMCCVLVLAFCVLWVVCVFLRLCFAICVCFVLCVWCFVIWFNILCFDFAVFFFRFSLRVLCLHAVCV